MSSCLIKPSYTKNGKRFKGRLYHAVTRLENWPKARRFLLRVSDKDCAKSKLAELLSELEREACGVGVPRSMRQAAEKPFQEHVEDYVANLSSQGCVAKHIENAAHRLKKLAKEYRWRWLRDVDADSFLKWRGEQGHLAPKTLNDYHSVVGAFFRWLDVAGRVDVNPLRRIRPVAGRGAEKRKRRALTPEQLESFTRAVGSLALVYFVAINTGLRRGELAALAWGDVRLGNEPEICLRASTTKNAKSGRQPLWKITAGMLRQARPESADEATLVFGKSGLPTMPQHRSYLQAAGIPYKDALDRQLDFHAMRHTFNTLLALSGADLHLRKELMRHSESRLTEENYTDKRQLPMAAAVSKVEEAFLGEMQLATGLAMETGTSRRAASKPVATRPKTAEVEVADNQLFGTCFRRFSRNVRNWQWLLR